MTELSGANDSQFPDPLYHIILLFIIVYFMIFNIYLFLVSGILMILYKLSSSVLLQYFLFMFIVYWSSPIVSCVTFSFIFLLCSSLSIFKESHINETLDFFPEN